jgi:hypothetical protein
MRATPLFARIGALGGFLALREEKLTAEYAETAEIFWVKKKNKSFYVWGFLFAF